MKPEVKKKLMAYFKKATAAWKNPLYEGSKKAGKKPSPRALELFKVIDGKFGCNTAHVLRLVEALEGISFEGLCKDAGKGTHRGIGNIPRGTVFIVTAGYDGHDYPTGVPILQQNSSDPCYMIKPDGTLGNSLRRSGRYVRPATTKEVAKITQAQIDAFQKDVLVI